MLCVVSWQLQVFASYFVYGFLSLFAAMGLQQSASSLPTAAPSLANTHSVSHRSLNPPTLLSARRDPNNSAATVGATSTAGASGAGSVGSANAGSLTGFGSFGYMSTANSSSVLNSNGLRVMDKDRDKGDSERGLLHGYNR